MTRALFLHSQTLHAKVTIPLALACLDRGWEVAFQANRPVFFGRSIGFSEKAITRNPTTVGILNPGAMDFVADLIGLGDAWRAARCRVRFPMTPRSGRYDCLIGTTKNILEVREAARALGVPGYAVGYQHFPFFARVDAPFRNHDGVAERESVFLSDNPFTRQHRFPDILAGCDLKLLTFTFLDQVFASRPSGTPNGRDQVLIFHPGGYRGVVTEPGEPKAACYAKQKAFLERLCIPLVREGLTPVVKVHPLRARYHDLGDISHLAAEVERENGLPPHSIKCLGPKAWFWEAAWRSAFILTFGSSSIYELWSAGLKNVSVCNFEGPARSNKFRLFETTFLERYDDYLELVNQKGQAPPKLDAFTARVCESYHALFDGSAVSNAMNLLERDLSAA